MAKHEKLPALMEPYEKLARVASNASSLARGAGTRTSGTIYVPNGDGTGTLIGELAGTDETGAPMGVNQFVYDTTPPSAPTGLSWTSNRSDITGYWDGTLTDGVPADFSYVELRAVPTAEDDSSVALAGRLTVAGSTTATKLTVGTEYDCYAVAVDVQGNVSVESEHTTVTVVDVVEQLKEDVDADVAKVKAKADALEGELDAANQKIEQTASDVEGIKTTAENAVAKAEESLTKATSAEQTATAIKSTADSAYKNAEEALTQASEAKQTAEGLSSKVTEAVETANSAKESATTAEQTATSLKTTVETDYLKKDDAASTYTSKTEFEQTAEDLKVEITEAMNNTTFNENLLLDTNAPSLKAVDAAYDRYYESKGASGYTCEFVEIPDPPVSTIKYGVLQENTTTGHNHHSVVWYDAGGNISGDAGEQYTMSCYAKMLSSNDGTIRHQIGFDTYDGSDSAIPADGEWHRASWTFTWPSTSSTLQGDGHMRIYAGGLQSDVVGKAYICGWKLEKGSVATSYSPMSTSSRLVRASGNGVEVARKINGEYASTKTLTDETGFHVLSSDGTELSSFEANEIDLGKNNQAAIISFNNHTAYMSTDEQELDAGGSSSTSSETFYIRRNVPTDGTSTNSSIKIAANNRQHKSDEDYYCQAYVSSEVSEFTDEQNIGLDSCSSFMYAGNKNKNTGFTEGYAAIGVGAGALGIYANGKRYDTGNIILNSTKYVTFGYYRDDDGDDVRERHVRSYNIEDIATCKWFYPVGAVYISYVSTSPASLFGGSWTQITGRFLRAANDVSTGGTDSRTLSALGLSTTANQLKKSDQPTGFTEFTGGKFKYRVVVRTVAGSDSYSDYAKDMPIPGDLRPAYQDFYVWRRTA